MHQPVKFRIPSPAPPARRLRRSLATITGLLWLSCAVVHADTAAVVVAANTLLATSEAANPGATSTSTIPAVMTDSYTLAIAKQWTNLPGGTRNGPTIGGGPAALTTDLSDTVPSGQTISPRAAAIALAETALSTAGYNTMNEIRNADDVIRATDNTQTWNFGNYHLAILGTPSTTTPWMLQISGHHLTYNITYNGPYVGATPMFIGTEPPNYFSIGTDLTSTEQTVVFGTFDPTTTTGGGGGGPGGPPPTGVSPLDATPTALTPEESFVSDPYNSSSATTPYATSDVSTVLTGATAISGATAATFTIAATTSADNGLYFCVATNASGNTTSNTVAVTVTTQANASLYNSTASTGTTPAPVFTTQPLSQTVATGSAVTLTVATDSATSYQWYKAAAAYRAPLELQRAAVSALANSLQADTTNASAGILTGQTFSDVVMGVTSAGDGNFPFINTTPTYPTGTTGRGVPYTSLNATEQAEVVAMIEAWVGTQASDISASLLADYLSASALAQTYVGYQVGAGAADGGTAARCNFDPTPNQEAAPINSQNSYLRVDGPRVWIEMVVQAAVAFKSDGFVHYHSLWRDKLADYGNEFGGYLDTTSTDTTYTRPTITAQPVATFAAMGNSATFTVTATGTGTLAYQWYFGSTPISGATNPTYAIAAVATTDAGSYYCAVGNTVGSVNSNKATLTVSTATGETTPTITTQPVSLTVATEESATFSVTATGSGTLSYQWYKDGTAISGATASSFTITAAASTDAGAYTCVVTNSVGSVTSSAATLTVTATSGVPVVNVTAGGDDEAIEGSETKGIFVFTRTGGDTSTALTVFYKAKGTAVNGTRYTFGGAALSGSVVIPAGAAKVKLKIKVVNDSVHEGTEKAKLVLKTPADGSYTLGTSTRAVVLVIDND